MELSVVTTLYRSAPSIAEFYRRISAAARGLTPDYEIILVNDGSPDESLEIARSLVLNDARVRVIDLARNFGHHRAIMIGLSYARGESIFLIDSDLEEEPELLTHFASEMAATRSDVIYGVQASRKGRLVKRIGGSIFYRVFNALSDHPIPPDLITARLMSRRYVQALIGFEERELFIGGVWVIAGFDQRSVRVEKGSRKDTSYTFRKRVSLLVNAITSFSSKPLVLVFWLGTFISIFSGLAAVVLVLRKLFFGKLLLGWASLIVSIWLLAGITIFCVGIIGIYLAKVFLEVKRRPYAIVREVYEQGPALPSIRTTSVKSHDS
jgi:putative glycosyltransferase